MPPIIQLNSGTVTGLRGKAMVRGADGKMHALRIGDYVNRGDVILTNQDGIVEIDAAPAGTRLAQPTKEGDIDRVITDLNQGDDRAAPAAGLTGGDGGNLQDGLRVDRISEATSAAGGFQNTLGNTPVVPVFVGGGTSESLINASTPPLAAGSNSISASEQGATVNLGLPLPSGAGAASAAVTIVRLPSIGEIHKADGSLVTASTVLTPADLPGLTYVPPADYVPGTPVGDFGYTVTSGVSVASGSVAVALTAVNDPPVATPAVASGLEDGTITVTLAGTDVDGTITGVTVASLPAGSTLFLADGVTAVSAGQTLTPAQAATLLFKPSPDFNGNAGISFTVTDNNGAVSAPASVNVTVNAVNDAPVASPGGAGSGLEDTPIAVHLGGTDVDGTILSVSVTVLPANGVLYLADGVTPVVAGAALTPAQAANLVFVPSANFNGPVPISFSVTDNAGTTSAPVTATITVTPVNDAPVASADTATALEDTPVTGNVLSNDTDIDGPALSLSQFSIGGVSYAAGSTATLAGIGTLVIRADGSYTFTPAPNFNGAVPAIGYTATDGSTTSNATLTIAVTAVNDAPTAVNDLASTPINAPVTIAVLANDRDVDGDPLTVGSAAVADPSLGTVTVNPNGTLSFTPVANYVGPVVISYTVTDPSGATSAASVTVNVGNNTPPTGADAQRALTEDGSYTVQAGDFGFADADAGQTLSNVRVETLPAAGSLLLAGVPVVAGQVISIADINAGKLVFQPAADANGAPYASLAFSVQDSAGGFAAAPSTLAFNVTPVNDAPVARPDVVVAAEDTPISGNLLANDSDVDGDTLSVTQYTIAGNTFAAGTPAVLPGVGTLLVNADGSFSFTPAANYAGPVPAATYTVTDGTVTTTGTLSLSVAAVNDAPAAVADSATTPEDSPASGNVLANDGDVDSATLTVTQFSIGGNTYAAGSTATLAGVGSLVIGANGAYTFTPAANYFGPVPVASYTVSDGITTSTATLTLNVSAVNDAPVAVADVVAATEDTPVVLNLLGNDSDVDGDPLTITAIAGNPIAVGSPVTLPEGSVTLNPDGTLTFTPNPNFNGPVNFSYTVSDGTASSSAGVTINVAAVNDAPVANNDLASTPINTPATLTVLANDTDADGDPLTVTAATLANAALGTVGINPDGTLAFTPAANVSGQVVINYTVTDPSGATSSASVTVFVGANTPPAGSDATLTINEDGSKSFAAADFGFSDADLGQTLAAVRIDTLPGAGSLTLGGVPVTAGQVINAADFANLLFTPAANANGAGYASFSFSVQDSAGAFDTTPNTLTLNVTSLPDAAVIGGQTSGATVEDTTLSATGTLTIIDPDAGEAAFVAQTAVAGAHGSFSINAAGVWTYTLNNADPAVQALGQGQTLPAETFTVSSIDGSTQVITVTITGTNDAAVITAGSGSVTEDTTLSTGGTLAITDADSGQAAFVAQAATVGSYGSFTLNAAGVWTYNLNNALPAVQALTTGQTLTETFSVASLDGTVSSVTVTINGTNDAAVIGGAQAGTVVEDGALVTGGALTVSDVDGAASFIAQPATAGAYGSFTLGANGLWSYALNNGLAAVQALAAGTTLSETFTVQSADGTSASVLVTIVGTDDAPVISSGTGSVVENTQPSASGTLSASDVDNPALAFNAGTIVGAYGSLVLAANGAWTYTLDGRAETLAQGQTVSDTLTVTLSDGSTTTVTLSVSGSNDAPVAQAANVTIAEDAPLLSSAVTAADADAGAVLGFVLNGAAPAGLVFNANGSYSFDPSNAAYQSLGVGQSQVITVPYTVTDGLGGASTANLVITVTGTNDAPVAAAAAASATEDGAIVNGSVSATDVDANAVLSFALNGAAPAGLIFNANGSYSFNPADPAYQSLAAGQTQTITVPYTVTDDQGATSIANLVITVTGTNDAPVVAGPLTGTVKEDTTLTSTGTLTISDADAGQSSFVAQSGVAGTYGSFALTAAGVWTYTLNNAAANVQSLAATASITDSFTVTTADGATRTVVVTVNGTNDAPVAASAALTVAEDAAVVSGSVSASDVDAGAVLSFTLVNPAPAGLTFNANGSYSFNAANAAYQSLGVGQSQVITVPYTVTDDQGASSTANLVITVTGTNDAPVAQAASASVTEDAAVFNGSVVATDIDANAVLSFALNGAAPAGLSFNTNGSYSFDPSNPAYQALAAGQTQVITIPYTVTDDQGATSTASLVITVTGTDDAPVISTATGSVVENTQPAVSGTLTATDADNPALAFNPGTVAGAYGSLVLAANGSWTYTLDGRAEALAGGQTVAEPITVTLNDGSTTTVTVSITGTNDAAVISGTSTGSVSEDGVVSATGTLTASDVDSPTTFNAASATGTYGNFSINAAGVWTYVLRNVDANVQALTSAQHPTESFTVTTADGTSQTITVTVNGTNEAPVGISTPASGLEDATSIPITLSGSDVDGSITSFTITALPANGVLLFGGVPVGIGSVVPASAGSATLSFVPNANWNGSTTITFNATDNEGASSPTVSQGITVQSVNDAPVATPDSTSTPINTPINNINVLANDSDVDGDTLSVTGASVGAAFGSVSVNPDGSLNFTPATNVTGPVVISYTVSDGQGGSSVGTLTVNVGANTPPTGSDATLTINEDGSKSFAASDFGFSDADLGQTLAGVRIDTLPGAGSLTLNGVPVTAGQVVNAADFANLVFTPAANANGAGYASFTFSVQDSAGGFDTTPNTLSVNVTPLPDAAVIGGQTSGATVEDSTLTATGTLTIVDPDAGEAAFVAQTGIAGAHGSFSINAAGVWTYTLNNADPAVQALGQGQTLPSEAFTVASVDGTTQVITVSITGTNDAPVAAAATASATEDGAVVNGSVTASDVDANAVLTFALNGAAPAGLVFNPNGTYSFNPADPAYQSLAAGQTQIITVPYTVTDDRGASSTANLVITLTGTNDTPTVSGPLTGTVKEDTTLTSTGTLVISDADAGQSSFVAQTGNAGSYGSFSLTSAGVWTYTLNNAAANVQALGATASVTDSFTITTADGTTRTVVVTVNGTNDAPVASAAALTVAEDAAIVNGAVSASDVDTGAVLAFALVNPAPAGLTFNSNGTYSFNAANAAYQSLGVGQSQVITVPYSVTDDQGATSTANLVITVTGTNDAPVAQAASASVTEDAAVFNGSVVATDIDANAVLSFALNGAAPAGLSFNTNGSYSFDPSNPAYQALAAGQTQTLTIPYTVTDDQGATSTANLVITITGTNDAAVIGGPLTGNVTEDGTTVSTGTLTVADPDAGQSSFVAQTGVAGTYGSFALTSAGVWTYNLNNGAANVQALAQGATVTDSFVISSADGTTRTVVVTVTGTNDAPVAQASSVTVAEDAALVNGSVTATDVDTGAVLSFALAGAAPAGLTFNSNGSYSFNPANAAYQALGVGQSQVVTVPYTVTDGQGATSTTNLVITVTGTNDAPVAAAASASANEDGPIVNGTVTATDIDANAVLSFALTGAAPAGLTFNSNGTYSFNPADPAYQSLAAGQTQIITVPYTVTDDQGATSIANLVITVTGTNDAPVVAGPLTGTVKEDTTLSSTGTLTITDADAGQSSFVAQTGVAGTYGSFALTSAGVWTYTLNNSAANVQALGATASVTDSFTITTADGTTRTVVVTVNGTNDAPVASAAALTVAEDAAIVNGAVTASDVDTGAVLSFALSGAAPAGLTFNSNGSYSFNPANAAYQSLGVGQSQVITVPYTVTDGQGATSTANLVITVTGTNDAPAAAAASASANEDGPIVNGTVTAADIDANAVLSFALTGAAPAGLTFNSNGTYSFNPADPAYQSLTAGQTQVITVPYRVTDDQGATSTANLVITITGTNDTPTITGPLTGTVKEDTTLTSTGTLVVSDADAGQSSFFAQSGVAGTYGSFSLTTAGVWTYTLNNAAANVQALGATASVTDSFTITTADGSTRTVVVTVNGTNDAAVITPAVVNLTETNAVLATGGTLVISDVDSAATFVAQSNVLGSNGYGRFTLATNGVWTYTATTAHNEFVAATTYTDTLTVTSADGTTSTIRVNILGTNDAAVITPAVASLTETNAVLTTSGTMVISDVDSAATFIAQSNVAGSNGYGTFSINTAGAWTYTTNTAHNEFAAGTTYTDTLTVASADGTPSTIAVNIVGTNDNPVANNDTATASEDTGIVITPATLLGNDSDVDTGDVLTISSVQGAVGGSVAINGSGNVVFTPTANFSGPASFTYTVSDGHGGTATATVSVAVAAVADAPTLVVPGTIFSLVPGAVTISTEPGITQANLEATLGLPTGQLDTFDPAAGPTTSDPGTVDVVDGKLTNYTVALGSGNKASFNWQFFNGEDTASEINSGFNDLVVLVVTDPAGVKQYVQLSSSEQTGINTNGAAADASGTYVFTAASAGDYQFSWLVLNARDTAKDSSISVSAPTVTIGSTVYGAPVAFAIGAGLNDSDGSETLALSVSGVPAGAAFSAGTNLGGGVWSFTPAQLDGLQLYPAAGFTGTLNLSVTATSTESSNGATASTTQAVAVTIESTTTSTVGTQNAETLTGTAGNDQLQGYAGDDTLNGNDGNDLLYGDAGNDALNGGNGNDVMYGGAGTDTLIGGAGNDKLYGGAGNDTLTGGTGTDVFAWTLADRGTAGAPPTDTITDFSIAAPAAGGDLLDLRDLLQGEAKAGVTAGNLERYLDFDTTSVAGSTIIHVSSTGGFAGGVYSAAAEDQRIVLTGVDVRSVAAFGLTSTATDNDIINQLLQRGKLVTDGA